MSFGSPFIPALLLTMVGVFLYICGFFFHKPHAEQETLSTNINTASAAEEHIMTRVPSASKPTSKRPTREMIAQKIQLGTIRKASDDESNSIMADFGGGDENNSTVKVVLGDNAATCAICLAEFESGEAIRRSSRCQHIFHDQCILDWLEKSDRCPSCRASYVDLDEDCGDIEMMGTRVSS